MKLRLDLVRFQRQAKLRASWLALVFSLQAIGLCCLPASADAHSCCPTATQTTSQAELSTAGAPAAAAMRGAGCCPEGLGAKGILRVRMADPSAAGQEFTAPPAGSLAWNAALSLAYGSPSGMAGQTTSAPRSRVLRI